MANRGNLFDSECASSRSHRPRTVAREASRPLTPVKIPEFSPGPLWKIAFR